MQGAAWVCALFKFVRVQLQLVCCALLIVQLDHWELFLQIVGLGSGLRHAVVLVGVRFLGGVLAVLCIQDGSELS